MTDKKVCRRCGDDVEHSDDPKECAVLVLLRIEMLLEGLTNRIESLVSSREDTGDRIRVTDGSY